MPCSWKWSARGVLFYGRTHHETAVICKDAGFDGIEFDPAMFSSLPSDRELEDIKKIYDAKELKIATFHLPFPQDEDIASFEEAKRRASVRRIRVWMEKAAVLGAVTGVLHPTTSRLNAEKKSEADKYLRQLRKSLGEIMPAAESLRLEIAVENMLPFEGVMARFGALAWHIELVKRELSHPLAGFCYDTGHALIAEKDEAPGILSAMEPLVKAFHLQDNAGDRDSHLAPGRGLVNWKEVFDKMRRMNFRGYATIEAPPFAYGPVYSPAAWKELLKDTRELAGDPGR